jgi:putative flippase GtrA
MKDHLGPVTRYTFVGTLNTAIYSLLLYLFLFCLQLESKAAVTLSFTIAMVFQFLANRYFTFRSSGALRVQLPRYLTMAALSYLVSLGLVVGLSDNLHLPAPAVVVICAAVTALLGYCSGYFWVFGDRR